MAKRRRALFHKKSSNGGANEINDTVRKLSHKKDAPKAVFAALLVLYAVVSVVLRKVSTDLSVVYLFGNRVPMQAFAGVFSSISNVCLIFLTVFFGKVGFWTSAALLFVQFPMMVAVMLILHNMTAIPGFFSNLLALVAITLVYINHARVHKYQRRILTQAVTDRLTGLPNRFACAELMDDFVARKKSFVAVAVELKNFKNINDTMGYDVGDKVLLKIADRWRPLLESFKGADYAAHIGGNEFFLILTGLSADQEVETAINSYKRLLEEKITVDGCDYFVGACFGWAAFPQNVSDSGSAFSCADLAAREAKKNGAESGIVKFVPEFLQADTAFDMERKIRRALDNGGIFFNLQPQYDMKKNLRGFEALARMKDADGNVISPVDFIPAAERVGLIDKVDATVFRKAAAFVGKLIRAREADIVLCMNVSVRHLMKNDFIDELREIIASCSVPARNLEIEITESIMIDSAEKALDRIRQVKAMGIKVAIDDFGTGYSSLSYLNKFPADMLKIDKSFIDVMNTSESSKQYVATIISIGHILNLKVISEGVETEDQLETLKNVGCDYIQGFIWGRPLPPEEAARLVC